MVVAADERARLQLVDEAVGLLEAPVRLRLVPPAVERGDDGLTSVPFGTEDWEAAYARRTREFLGKICERGARRAIVILPIDVNRPDLQQRLHRIRDVQERAASITTCAVTLETAGDLGDFELEGVQKRLPDGFHMSALGAQIVWDRILPKVLGLLADEAR